MRKFTCASTGVLTSEVDTSLKVGEEIVIEKTAAHPLAAGHYLVVYGGTHPTGKVFQISATKGGTHVAVTVGTTGRYFRFQQGKARR